MNKKYISLNFLPLGKTAKVKFLTSSGIMRRRMLDLGLVSDTVVEAFAKSSLGRSDSLPHSGSSYRSTL